MCGIYGIAKSPTPYNAKQYNDVRRIIRDIAINSETRGKDSSGIASVGNNVKIHKSLLKSSKFVDTKEYNSVIKSLKNDTRIILGHTRFATQGKITASNSHPFKVGNTVGAHNGCVYNVGKMEKKLDKVCPVDSQLIFKSIDKSNTIEEAVKYFDSDFALCFVKDNLNVLHLCRETNRPLYVAYVSKLKTLFFASETEFLEDSLWLYGEYEPEVYKLKTNILYSFDVNKFSETTSVIKTDFKYESRVYQYNLNNYNHNIAKSNYQSYLTEFSDTSIDSDLSEVTFDEDGMPSEEWYKREQEELSSIYGGLPQNWFYDNVEEQWFYLTDSNNTYSEEQMCDSVSGNYHAPDSDDVILIGEEEM